MVDLVKLGREFLGPSTFSEILGKIVFSQRIRQGLEQDELAEKSKVEPKIIYRIEGGSGFLTSDFEKVIKALDLSVKDIGEAIISVAKEE